MNTYILRFLQGMIINPCPNIHGFTLTRKWG